MKIHPMVLFFYLIIGLLVLMICFAVMNALLPSGSGKHDAFAQCLGDSNVTFFGAWWCNSCKAQKDMFGNSWHVYEKTGSVVECSDSRRGQTKPCRDANIKQYPTWRFPDDKLHLGYVQVEGYIPLENISELSGCKL